MNAVRAVASKTKSGLALVGFGYIAYQSNDSYKDWEVLNPDDEEKKRKCLVLPFHRMTIVETKMPNLADVLPKLGDDNDDKQMTVEIHELIDMIHAASDDPDIVAIHATFGHGFGFQCGLASIEELRTAIRKFNESRVDMRDDDDTSKGDSDGNDKPKTKMSFCYADTFEHPIDSVNREYYLASAFSSVHLQPRGNMNVFGMSLTNTFIKGALEKYGIKVHVFKHGKYKNAPNVFSEKKYTRAHLENSKSLVQSINETVCSQIVKARSLEDNFTSTIWKSLFKYGTITAPNAIDVSLVDGSPKVNPLDDMLRANKKNVDDEFLSKLKDKYGESLGQENFLAEKSISIEGYSSLLSRRKKVEKQKHRIYSMMKEMSEKSAATEGLLTASGFKAPHFNLDKDEHERMKHVHTKEKVAVVRINGTITDKVASTVSKSLREIKDLKDVKCVVLRIDSPGGSVVASESILEQVRELPQPVICSFSNLAASGGYYVSCTSQRTFALPTTLTGSIGVFGMKFDLSELANRHGVKFQTVGVSEHAATYSLTHPLTKKMRLNLTRNMDRVYSYFKEIVGASRGMSSKEVERVAQGRVWTGQQAKDVGLVDELGGLDDALSYAKKTYTSEGDAEVVMWPKKRTLAEILKSMRSENSSGSISTDLNCIQQILLRKVNVPNPPISLSMDESNALDAAIGELIRKDEEIDPIDSMHQILDA